MMKIKMLFRFTGIQGKMEPGHIYHVPPDYGNELVKTGLAELVVETIEQPVSMKVKEIGRARTQRGRFMPKAEKV